MYKPTDPLDQIILPPFNRWFAKYANAPVTHNTADIIYDEMIKPGRKRSGSFAASSSGKCIRRQSYDYYGAKQKKPFGQQTLMIFKNGTWSHLRWQAMLLDAGILEDIEVPASYKPFHTVGTLDGRGTVDMSHPNPDLRGKVFGFEFKTISNKGFEQAQHIGLKDEHLRQIHKYFVLKGCEVFSVVYEDKQFQALKEWVVTPDPQLLEDSYAEIETLTKYLDKQELPPKLPSCIAGMGSVFNDCPYGGKGGICYAGSNSIDGFDHE